MDCVLILSHGNADPKSGFSVSDRLLNYHGSKTSGETSEALKFLKNLLNRKGGVESIKFRQALIKVCQNAHLLYRQELPEKRKQELEEAAIRVQEREKKQDKLKEMDNDLDMIKSGIEISENIIKDSNGDLESLLTEGILYRDALTKAHQKISMGIKRKSELEISLEEAQKIGKS